MSTRCALEIGTHVQPGTPWPEPMKHGRHTAVGPQPARSSFCVPASIFEKQTSIQTPDAPYTLQCVGLPSTIAAGAHILGSGHESWRSWSRWSAGAASALMQTPSP